MTCKVLIIGGDVVLVETRAQLLKTRYELQVENPSRAMDRLQQGHFDLLLVCYSTPHDEATGIIQAAREQFPHLRILRLLSGSSPRIDQTAADRTIIIEFHPEQWMNAVHELLTPVSQGRCETN